MRSELGAELAAQQPESDIRPDDLSPREVEVTTRARLVAYARQRGLLD